MSREVAGFLLALITLLLTIGGVWFLWDLVISVAVSSALCEAMVEELLRPGYCS